ncbi:opacity family porin [Neisseria sp. ZJ106]|uniref:Outer membrane beta-barrel protein n=1 Tax=Neisseria lisongii TaxID=2912188 RepID=A0ABY7RJ92_9NEIS|nr:opacity family porin [Neisseria lisongii]MCF7521209.1 opacity family porin [Neisseria lisongii]WCL71702.1 outer membrane beta-barrel protein [Neisseria lisongii]
MKQKIFAAALAIALPAAALAQSTPGFYVQGDVGHATLNGKVANGVNNKVKGFSPRVSVGYDFGNNIRAAVDYTHYKNRKNNSENFSSEFKPYGVGVSAIYDIETGLPVKPYVGARLGINHVSAKVKIPGRDLSYSETKTGIGALVGVSYDVTSNIALDAGYRYNYWGKFGDVKLHSNEFHGGVRVKF